MLVRAGYNPNLKTLAIKPPHFTRGGTANNIHSKNSAKISLASSSSREPERNIVRV